jgi:hypothetical protein
MKTRIQQKQSGSAVIVVLALLFLVMAYAAFNHRTLESLNREVKLIEKRQIRRLQNPDPSTNSLPLTNPTSMHLSFPISSEVGQPF